MRYIFFLVLTAISSLAAGQKIVNLRAEAQGDKIVVTYDLMGIPDDRYDVDLFSSHNNFAAPLRQVKGDVGKNLQGGTAKRIEWDAKSELGDFKGQLTFEVHATVMAPLAIVTMVGSVKRGTMLGLTWRGGDKTNDVKIELMKGGQPLTTLITTPNSGSFSWDIPPRLKPGEDYQLRMTNGNEMTTSSNFAIRRKIPLIFKAAAPAILLVAVILMNGSSKPTGTPDPVLPVPPNILD